MKNETYNSKSTVCLYVFLVRVVHAMCIRRRGIKEWPKFCTAIIRTNSFYAHSGSLQTSILLPPSTFTWRFHYLRKNLFLLFPAFSPPLPTTSFPVFLFHFFQHYTHTACIFLRNNTSFTRAAPYSGGELVGKFSHQRENASFLARRTIMGWKNKHRLPYQSIMPPLGETNWLYLHKGDAPASTHLNFENNRLLLPFCWGMQKR